MGKEKDSHLLPPGASDVGDRIISESRTTKLDPENFFGNSEEWEEWSLAGDRLGWWRRGRQGRGGRRRGFLQRLNFYVGIITRTLLEF